MLPPMNKIAVCSLKDSCGNKVVLRDKTLRELMGDIGPAWPVVLNGQSGTLRHDGEEVVFRPA